MALAIWNGPSRDETADAAKAFGLPAEAFGKPDPDRMHVEIWPEHEVAFEVFRAMRTQWRVGFGGPYALDYSVLEFTARQVGVGRKALKRAFPDLQVMESIVIQSIAEKRKD